MELFIFIVPVMIALFVVLSIYSYRKAKARREALRAWAAERGMYYSRDKVRSFDDEYPEFGCLRKGSNRYAYNIIAGKLEGWETKLFDYHYETHSTDSKGRRQTHHHRFSAVIVDSGFPLKLLSIRPEHILHKLSAAFGWDDIDFESAEFSRRYHVKSPDKRWAYDVIHGRVMERLLGVRGYAFQCDEGAMICVRKGCFEVEGFEEAFRLTTDILGQIPGHAKERVAYGA